MPYNPFDKPLGQNLTASDLQQLVERKVAEGYFVEYKRQFPSSEKVGHSIASLANTGGGWYFVGVEEQGRVASHIGGCPTADERDPVKRLRDIVKTHIDPVPIFYPQEVQLEDEKWVLAVYVPNEQETPFITKNGRIYRRTFDSSDPVPETSRHALDRLYDAGRDIRQRFAEFCQDPRIFSKSEDKTGWISVFLAPSPIGGIERFDLLSPSGIEALLQLVASPVPLRFIEAEEWASGNIAFVWAQPTVRSVILRQLEPNRAAFNSMQAEFFVDGRARLFVPVMFDRPPTLDALDSFISATTRSALYNIWKTDDSDLALLRFFDIGGLLLTVGIFVNHYRQVFESEAHLTDVRVGLRADGIWRSVPFCDIDTWGTHVAKFGLPVATSGTMTLPEEIGRGRVMKLHSEPPLWVAIAGIIGLAFGLPLELSIDLAIRSAERRTKEERT